MCSTSRSGAAATQLMVVTCSTEFRSEPVSDSPLGLNISRLLRVIAELLAQPSNEHFQIGHTVDVFGSPYLLEQIAMRQNGPGLSGKLAE